MQKAQDREVASGSSGWAPASGENEDVQGPGIAGAEEPRVRRTPQGDRTLINSALLAQGKGLPAGMRNSPKVC